MKRLVVCCDGTWNGLSGLYPSNVLKLSQAIVSFDAAGVAQQLYYQQGLGTRWYDRWVGGAFGWGIDDNIADAYRFLSLNYDPGDQIFLFGFSRGAYTVRSLAGLMNKCGLLRRTHIRKMDEAYRLYRQKSIRRDDPVPQTFRTQNSHPSASVTFLGCWDTVGALGVPNLVPGVPLDRLVNRKYTFHDEQLSALVERAYHAIAVDERRRAFDVTHMEPCPTKPTQVVVERWFPGNHGCVGGGTETTRGLSDRTLDWMMQQAEEQGLACDRDQIEDGIEVDALADFDGGVGLFILSGVIRRNVPPDPSLLDESTVFRLQNRNDYRPSNLSTVFAALSIPSK